ncbi:MAG: divalent-cation tolerance protein CutA [Anaerolineae bacterium]|jgi:periplasmic divalent cation tolerance protein
MEGYVVILVTAPSEEVGTDIAQALLQRKLCACVNVVSSVASMYHWDDRLCHDEEVLLLIKTTRAAFDRLAAAVRAVHPYDVPEIVALPISTGAQDYLAWVDDSVEISP